MNNFQRSWHDALKQWPVSRVAWRAHCALWRRLTREQKQILLCQDQLILVGNHHGNTYRLPWAGRLQIGHPRARDFTCSPACTLTADHHLSHRADVILAMKIWIEINERALGNRIGTNAQWIYFPEWKLLPPVSFAFGESNIYTHFKDV